MYKKITGVLMKTYKKYINTYFIEFILTFGIACILEACNIILNKKNKKRFIYLRKRN